MTTQAKQAGMRIPKWIWAALVVAVFCGANAHLVYVAITSQPQCLDHLKERGDQPGAFRAASPSC
ncbi:MAG: hypothetical protein BGN83_19480 [Rhizobium sp. 63-7]|nr:MAG: hypothetical protein BGN83_19480 [Rhizobium sp. 63-7]